MDIFSVRKNRRKHSNQSYLKQEGDNEAIMANTSITTVTIVRTQ